MQKLTDVKYIIKIYFIYNPIKTFKIYKTTIIRE